MRMFTNFYMSLCTPQVCPSSHGASVQVDGYPASPWRWEPFTRNFTKPAHAQRARSYCK